MVTGRILAADQPPRAISSFESGSTASEEQDNSHIFGQRDGHVLSQQGRGSDSISSSEQAEVGHSDILSGSWIVSNTSQSECGRQDTQVDLFASLESAHLPVYFFIYRKDSRAEGSMLNDQCSMFRGGRSRRNKRFQLLN